MQRKFNRRFVVLSAAAMAVGLMGAGQDARAQNIIVSDSFDDGDIATNTLGTGSGFTLGRVGEVDGVETGGAFRADTSTLGGFNLQGINSKDAFEFWNPGGATVRWTTGNVAVNAYNTGSHGPFIGGPGADSTSFGMLWSFSP